MRRSRSLPVAVGAVCALVVAAVAANHALAIQVVGAGAGAVMTTGGVALASSSWPHRRVSEVRNLLVAFGFFLACLGASVMAAGVGLYH